MGAWGTPRAAWRGATLPILTHICVFSKTKIRVGGGAAPLPILTHIFVFVKTKISVGGGCPRGPHGAHQIGIGSRSRVPLPAGRGGHAGVAAPFCRAPN